MLPTVSSWTCSALVSRNSGSIVRVLSRSKPLMFKTLSTDTLDWVDWWMGAKALMVLILAVTLSMSAAVTRSTLFRMMRSANASCSTASFSAPSGLTSSRCCSTCFASTRVIMPSKRAKVFTFSSTKKVCATGAGSAIPVVSMTMPSRRVPVRTFSASFSRTTTRSCRTVQQMQPFIISMISSSACMRVFFLRSSSSMPTSPNSFSITASFFPCSAVRMWLSKVVFPLPRKPVKTVTGTRLSSAFM
mmetsp:Transcript_30087/g.59747  ORF Transcript_30087/g.59747 Transcript_30087/m.59747 type:complete len:246 (-) Transcript_30087:168-905(-)